MTSRNYCFTSFNEVKYDAETMVYMIVGREECPETKRIHWQGYVEFNKSIRIAAAKKAFNDDTIHFEKRKGTQQQAIDYCKKDNEYVEYGRLAKQGRRTDLETVINTHDTIEEVMDKEPVIYCQYRNGLKDIYARKLKSNLPSMREVKVEVYWGVTGSGKTYKAITDNEGKYYKLPTITKGERANFDGYEGEEVLIIDEFYGQINYPLMLQITDKYKLQLQVKGSTTWAQWKKVIITSNSPPSQWYPDIQDISALMRRLVNIVHFDKPYDPKEEEEKAVNPIPLIPPLINPLSPPICPIDPPDNKKRRIEPARTQVTDDLENFKIDVCVSDDDVNNTELITMSDTV